MTIRFRTGMTYFLPVLFLLTIRVSFAQETAAENPTPAMGAAINSYYRALGEQAGLYNGTLYTGYPEVITDGHQYFLSEEVTPGTVFYDGMIYANIPMRYDLVKNELVILGYYSQPEIVLRKEKIAYFSLHGHTFIHLQQGGRDDFYDRIYNGRTPVFVTRSKNIFRGLKFIRVLKEKDHIYIEKSGILYPADSEKEALNIFGSRRKEILSYLQKNKVRFGKDPLKAAAMMAAWYDQINIKP